MEMGYLIFRSMYLNKKKKCDADERGARKSKDLENSYCL